MSTTDFRLLRLKADIVDDADVIGTQNLGSITPVPVEPAEADISRPMTVEVVYEWLTSGDAVVAAGDRGSVTLTPVRRIDRGEGAGTGQAIVDGAAVAALPAFSPRYLDDVLAGDELTVRLHNIAAPATGAKLRVLYRVMPEES